MILTNLQKGVDVAQEILRLTIPRIPQKRECACATALRDAIATLPEYISDEAKADLKLLIRKYLDKRKIG